MENSSKTKIFIALAIIIALLIILFIIFGTGKKYTVEFNSNGGTAVASQTIKENETAKEPTSPTRDGYIFLGWYINDNEKYDFSSKVTKNITLKAKWEKEQKAVETTAKIKATKTEIDAEEELQLKLEGIDLTGKTVTWTSSNDEIVTVDENGKVKGVKAGTAIITATLSDGTKQSIRLTVKGEVEASPSPEATATTATTRPSTPSTKTPAVTPTEAPATEEPTTAPTTEPTVEPTETPVTYSAVWVPVAGSTLGQEDLFIKSSKGGYVSGTAVIVTKGGETKTVSIPTTGKRFVRDTVASVTSVTADVIR